MAANKKVTKSAVGKAVNPFMEGGEDRGGKPNRWTHDDDNVGTTLFGRFIGQRAVTFADRTKGTADIFAPAIVMDENGAITAYARIETLHSAGLESAINAELDKRAVFAIEYTGKQSSRVDGFGDFKTFKVVKQSVAKLAKTLRECEALEMALQLAAEL